ncbi:flavodoxin family protein [Candidatus Micrarchaeota archaeon]|nr:flavodoxin family protein [Candidatus Micrarchaeota archaeon]
MHLIVFAHPDNEKSHNAAILRHVEARLKADFREYNVIDLYSDGFEPVLRLTPESEQKNELVKKYRHRVDEAECLVFIFPVWWNNMPAILKGFFDIVFSPGFSHEFNSKDGKIKQKLSGKKAVAINTFGRSEDEYRENHKSPDLVLDDAILRFCGVEVVSRLNWFDVRPPSIIPPAIANKIDEVLVE